MPMNPKSTAAIGGHPIHPMLVVFPIAFLLATLVTDFIYINTQEPGWAIASMWLVATGVITALAAALAGFADFFGDSRVRAIRDAWRHMIGNLIAVTLAAISWGLRVTEGPAEAVLPWGLTLSVLIAGILAYTGWKGGELAYRHRVGVRNEVPETPIPATRERERTRERT